MFAQRKIFIVKTIMNSHMLLIYIWEYILKAKLRTHFSIYHMIVFHFHLDNTSGITHNIILPWTTVNKSSAVANINSEATESREMTRTYSMVMAAKFKGSIGIHIRSSSH